MNRGAKGPLHTSRLSRVETLRRDLRETMDRTVDRLLGDELRDRFARVAFRHGSTGVDPFGMDPRVVTYAVLVARMFYRRWFRTEVFGLQHVPEGRVLLISNHSGQVPLDGMAIACAMLLDRDPPRIVRSMVEKWTASLPFVSEFFPRVGQIVGVPENCLRLLEMEEAILVFPEGSRGISKPFRQRYRLGEFGSGFMRLALQTRCPVVPVAVIGAEEQYVSVADLKSFARVLGMPAFPIIPQLLLPGGFLPLPTKYRIHFGEPMTFAGDPDDEDAVLEEKVKVVRGTVQSMINRGLKERPAVFW